VPEGCDAKLLQVLSRQVRSLILSKAKAPQPDRDVHFGAPNSGLQHIIVRSGQSVQEVPKAAGQALRCQSVPLS